jgi:hypothetical protein
LLAITLVASHGENAVAEGFEPGVDVGLGHDGMGIRRNEAPLPALECRQRFFATT